MTGTRSPRAAARTAAVAAVLAASLAAATAGCYRERERLDVPEIALELEDSVVAPRGTVRGVVRATDGSGLSFLRWLAVSALDPARERLDTICHQYDLNDQRSVAVPLTAPLDTLVPAGSFVEIRVFVLDT